MKTIRNLLILILSITFFQSQAQDYKLPAYEKFKLKNGLTVYLMEQHEVPMINVSVILPAGAIYDGTKAGLASFTADGLKYGTKKYSKSQLDEELDFIAASVDAGASKESARVMASFASKDQEKAFDILQQVLLYPVFEAGEFEKEKKRALISLEQAKERPRSVIGGYFDKFIFGDHVYGNNAQGTINTVTNLKIDDLKNFYQANYGPQGSAIAVVGDFDKKEMKSKITKLFKDWSGPKQKQNNEAGKSIAPLKENRVLLINKDDARETTFIIGSHGISRNNPDYVAVDVINTLFGGRFTSMLNDELRVNTGLTYGAGSRFSTLKNSGSFVISTFTANKTTEQAIDKALEVLNNLHAKGISDTMLQSAKNYVKGQFPPEYETSGSLATLMTEMFWYGFDESFINNFQKNVDGLTTEKAQQIIAKYFPKDKLQIVVVGKSSEIKKIMEKYGTVTEVQIGEEVKKAF